MDNCHTVLCTIVIRYDIHIGPRFDITNIIAWVAVFWGGGLCRGFCHSTQHFGAEGKFTSREMTNPLSPGWFHKTALHRSNYHGFFSVPCTIILPVAQLSPVVVFAPLTGRITA